MIDKQMIEFAIEGVNAKIAEIEKTVKQGKQFITEYENGQQPKTPKTLYELKTIVQEKNTEIEKLLKLKHDYEWLLVENEQ